MAPAPSTPNESRFRLPRRPDRTAASQATLESGGDQRERDALFVRSHSSSQVVPRPTPRFVPSWTQPQSQVQSQVQTPARHTAPAARLFSVGAARRRGLADEIDEGSSSPSAPAPAPAPAQSQPVRRASTALWGLPRRSQTEDIEEAEGGSERAHDLTDDDEEEEDQQLLAGSPARKRRRLVVSPGQITSSPPDVPAEERFVGRRRRLFAAVDDIDEEEEEEVGSLDSDAAGLDADEIRDMVAYEEGAAEHSDADEEERDFMFLRPAHREDTAWPRAQLFAAATAPRPSSDDEANKDAPWPQPPPDFFSPQKRAKRGRPKTGSVVGSTGTATAETYVPGGLASELRDWLVQIKSGTWSAGGSKAGGRFVAEQVRTAPGLCLVRGRSADAAEAAREKEEPIYLLLAGRGRGVVAGSVVTTAPPVWDIDLDGRRWTVASDWAAE